MKDSFYDTKEGQECKTNQIIDGISGHYGIDEVNQKFKMIDEITVEDIKNAANYIFQNKPTYSLIATENTLEANKEFLNSLCA